MTEKQKLLLQLFREVDAICKKHDLRYVMAGGTLIGVLRNEGFIPWDDDVDIYMPKSDWDKFVEICQNEMPPNRAVYCAEVDRNYTNGFPRYGSTDTCAIHKHQIIGDDKAGEIIDVLTLDPIPDDDREYEKYRDDMMIYTDLINISMVVGARWEISAWKYLYWLFRYKFFGKDRTLKNALDYYAGLGKEFYDELCSMLVFDAVIYNEDRHFGNFGILRDNHTGKIIKPAPIFDNGLSLFNFAMTDDLANLSEYAKTRTPPYGVSFDEVCKAVMGSKQKSQLRKLLNFTFTRHPSINLPEERLTAIEAQISKRARELMSIPNSK